MEAQRFIMAGGGTGGHIFPAIAIANALKKMMPDAEFLFIGARGKMEMEKVPKAGFQIEGLTIAGFNRSSLIKNIQLPFKLVKSFIQVYRIFKHFKPTAVIGVGGYSSFPVLRFAQSKNIPTFIHESNSFAGKSNILLGKKATQIFFPNPIPANYTAPVLLHTARLFYQDGGRQPIKNTGKYQLFTPHLAQRLTSF